MPEDQRMSDPLDSAWLRVADICNGCRRCFHLCPSFDTLFDLLDRPEIDGDVRLLPPSSLSDTEDGCNYCKLCFNHCPYCPPHTYMLDFPDIMIRSRIRRRRASGIPRMDRLLSRTDIMGRLGTRFAGTINAAIRNPLLRRLGRKWAGIHESAPILPYAHETFMELYGKRRARLIQKQDASAYRVALFVTCLGNYQKPEIPEAMLRILDHHEIPVIVPGPLCCGMPFLDAGDLDSFRLQASKVRDLFLPYVRDGYQVVVPVPTCQLTLKKEFLQYGGEDDRSREGFRALSGQTWDFFQFLEKLLKEGLFRRDFKTSLGQISYHVACHLRDQNIGAPAREILGQIPDTRLLPVELCSGHGGTWGMKTENFPLARKKAGKTAEALRDVRGETWSSDCPLAAHSLSSAGGTEITHPAVLLRKAYGI